MRKFVVDGGRMAVLVVVTCVLLAALVQAQPQQRERRPPRPEGPAQAGDDLSFEQHMKGMGRALRGVKRSVETLDTPEAIERAFLSVQSFQEHALGAKAKFSDVPMSPHAREEYGENTEAYHRGFRHHLIEALEHSIELERAIMKKDTAAITKALNELEELEHHAHDEFQDEEH
ncbi:MAG: hypothetical protein KDA21_05440 [Phycisphaerales bacterium]|nr:hypothetical protein [Phycisphaerales bacterium]